MSSTIPERLQELQLSLPMIPASSGIYHSCLEVDGLLYLSGHVSIETDGGFITGKVGSDITDEEAKRAARQCGLALLATINNHLGSFDRLQRVVKIFGMVNATPNYADHALVINGCSQLLVDILGDDLGKGVRSAVGMGSLPNNVAVEVEAIFGLRPAV